MNSHDMGMMVAIASAMIDCAIWFAYLTDSRNYRGGVRK